jgi:signal recognition particle receptor subunit beta
MIYNVTLLNVTSRRKIANLDYWSSRPFRAQLNQYLADLAEVKEKSEPFNYDPTVIDDFKFFSRSCGEEIVLVLVTDQSESDDVIKNRINRAARALRGSIRSNPTKYIKKNFASLVDSFVMTRFVIALVGESGVGKTSLLHLLMGKPPPREHFPTIALNTEVIQNIRFANLEIMILDFAGLVQSRKLWDFGGTNMFFLVTDSTLKNLIVSKDIISMIKQEHPTLPIRVFANKQDLPHALDSSAIGKVMGVDAQSMVAVDLSYRNTLLDSLVSLLCDYFGIEVPDVPADVLLSFSPD